MHMLLWMTSLDTHGFRFYVKIMKPFMSFQSFVIRFKMKKGFTITCLRSDYEREFENIDFEEY